MTPHTLYCQLEFMTKEEQYHAVVKTMMWNCQRSSHTTVIATANANAFRLVITNGVMIHP